MIEAVLKLLSKDALEAEGLELFSSLLLTSTFEQSLAPIKTDRLARYASEAFAFISNKPKDRHVIRARHTDVLADRADGSAAVNAIEILNDDMPFIVESVLGEIHGRGLTPRLVFHPFFKTERDQRGRLVTIIGPGDGNWQASGQESYICILLDPLSERAAGELVRAIEAVLEHVRYVASDHHAMRDAIAAAISAYESMPAAWPDGTDRPALDQVHEASAFLRWLADDHFTPMGMREFDFVWSDEAANLSPSQSPALGVFRDPAFQALRRGSVRLRFTPEIRAFYNSPSPLIITKANAVSRVSRRIHLDYIGIKRYSPAGKLIGELTLVGLFNELAYLQPLSAVPLLRQKRRSIIDAAGFSPGSHNDRMLADILETFPRDELFQIELELLKAWAMALVDLRVRPRTRVLVRRDTFDRYYSLLVYMPRDVYSSAMREKVGTYLSDRFAGRVAAFYPFVSSSPLVRTQFIIALGETPPAEVADSQLEADIDDLLRTWPDRLAPAIAASPLAHAAAELIEAYGSAFTVSYTETFSVERAVEDIARIERLTEACPVAIDFYREPDAPATRVRAAVYRYDVSIPLSERVPLLENLGFRVIDERSYTVRPQRAGNVRDVVLHDMVLETADGAPIDLARSDHRLEQAFLAVFDGRAENDRFNALVLSAGLDWRQAAILRAYAVYLLQIRLPFERSYIAETLVLHPAVTSGLIDLFRARFNVDVAIDPEARGTDVGQVRQRIEADIANIASLDEDRILRHLLNVIMSTVRTNASADAAAVVAPETTAFKIDSAAVDGIPGPAPYREIFVYSPRVEGIHMRFAAIARGGIRWSDRTQDYRSEVLGLAKAQQVKNTVIVPSGAKGGFVPKQLAHAAQRDDVTGEGLACYRLFISALLSLTDNIEAGEIVAPSGLVRHDQDDCYLVAAADKGTATFSDDANEIAVRRGFWLGDAFASGGSTGYDHKRMGITARGAWECVKRHFREMDFDIQSQPFRVAGVGDMSGDVFGNAMLLSQQIRLVAAFDHRHILIDPDPDPAASFAERQRLFQLSNSTWADYDATKISPGGGVFARSAKSITMSPEIKTLLGIVADRATPNDVLRAILMAEVDLLWFGGIGTYVRDSNETDEQASDRSNDAIRITGAQVRAKVIGEGANLAVTQHGRIEAARQGVRLNADFIDNSAGVNTSDQEVNIKIALAQPLASGRLASEERNQLLQDMAPEVAAEVLANNAHQAIAISLAERTSARDIESLAQLARQLEERGLFERKLEALPSGPEFTQRAARQEGLSRPQLAVLLSWAKIALKTDLLKTSVADETNAQALLMANFPAALRRRFLTEIYNHPLRREIVVTRITNTVINRGGPAVMVKLTSEVGQGAAEHAGALMATSAIFDLDQLWSSVEQLSISVPSRVQLDLFLLLQDMLIDGAKKLLKRRDDRTFAELVDDYRPAAEQLAPVAHRVVAPPMHERMARYAQSLTKVGVPQDLAARMSSLEVVSEAMDFADIGKDVGCSVEETAHTTFAAADFLRLDALKVRARAMIAADTYEARAIDHALSLLELASRDLCLGLLICGWTGDVASWAQVNKPRHWQAKPVLDEIAEHPEFSVARLVVAAAAVHNQ